MLRCRPETSDWVLDIPDWILEIPKKRRDEAHQLRGLRMLRLSVTCVRQVSCAVLDTSHARSVSIWGWMSKSFLKKILSNK